jgi:hypothetical protein
MMQINLTGFLGGSKARLFIGELWNLLASAQSSPDGIPIELVEMKKKELQKVKIYNFNRFFFRSEKGNKRSLLISLIVLLIKLAKIEVPTNYLFSS